MLLKLQSHQSTALCHNANSPALSPCGLVPGSYLRLSHCDMPVTTSYGCVGPPVTPQLSCWLLACE